MFDFRYYSILDPSLGWPSDITLWIAISVLGGTVTFVVQTFYAYRLHLLAHSWAIMIFIVLLALVQFVLIIISAGLLFGVPGPADAKMPYNIHPYSNSFLYMWGGFGITCDLAIAIAMTYFLLRNDTGWKTTHVLLVKLVRLAIETGTVTMFIAATYLISTLPTFDAHSAYISPTLVMVLGKIYSNAMMVNFTHRIQVSGGWNETQIVGFTMPSHLQGSSFTAPSNQTLGVPVEYPDARS
ncbi:hypothetical protein L208DRAFT_1385112 [Tricholoma matsutake]|nr:hypothetical protein L208DRAFT_1385112 [Tricholoma matsutake 945]